MSKLIAWAFMLGISIALFVGAARAALVLLEYLARTYFAAYAQWLIPLALVPVVSYIMVLIGRLWRK